MSTKKPARRTGVEARVTMPPAEEFAGSDGERAKRAGSIPSTQNVRAKTDKSEQRAYRRNRPPTGA